MGILDLRKKWSFLTLVNGWNSVTNVKNSSTLDLFGALDMPLVSEGYVCD